MSERLLGGRRSVADVSGPPGWRWLWGGGWLTGYGMHWAVTSDNPWGLYLLAPTAVGLTPLAAQWMASRQARKVKETA